MGFIKMNNKNKNNSTKPPKSTAAEADVRSADPAESAEDITRKPAYTETSSTIMAVLKAALYICFIIIISSALAFFAISFVNDMYAFVKDSEEIEIEIPEYASAEDVSEILGESGVIKYPWLFRLYAKLKHVDDLIAANPDSYAFVAGTHTVNGMMNYDELIINLRPKSVRTTIRLTIPEGYNVEDIINLFTSNGIGTREGFIDAINNGEYDFDFVDAIDMEDGSGRKYRLEGYLYPDTYDFYTDNSESYYIYKLLDRFDEIFPDAYREALTERGFTADQIVTLASMVQKEAKYESEFGWISSVFNNRLSHPGYETQGYLNSDATTLYGLDDDKGFVTGEDNEKDGPYNTYTRKGLPVGPIANPSYSAITWALYPAETDYYYFVAKKDGYNLFAKTAAEHAQNKIAALSDQ